MPTPSKTWKLRECYEHVQRPILIEQGAAKSTFQQYQCMLRMWDRMTGDPAICDITNELLSDWKSQRNKQVSHETCNKEIRMINCLLAKMGPYERGKKRHEVLKRPAHVSAFGKKQIEHVKEKRPVTKRHWRALERASVGSGISTLPEVPGPFAMRLAIVTAFSTGLRESDLFRIRFGNLHLKKRCPIPNWGIKSEHGWIWIDPRNKRSPMTAIGKTKKTHLIPLTRSLRTLIDRVLKSLGDPADDLHLIPMGGSANKAARRRRETLHNVNDLAGIERPHLLWQSLRVGANEAWDLAKPGAGPMLLQHAMNGVNDEHYRTGAELLVKARKKLREPFRLAY